MAYIIDRYSKYNSWDREHSVYQFEVNGNWYAIFEVELEWGLPRLDFCVGEEKNPKQYFVYDRKEEALKFVRLMKGLN